MKTTSFSVVAAMITLALAGGAATATGCGPISTAPLCSDICACEGCTSNDFEACKAKGSAAADAAEAAGCSNQYEDAVACSSANVSCKSDRSTSDGCAAELAALTKCSSTLSVFGKNPCELASDKILAKIASCPNPPTVSSGSGSSGEIECSEAAGALFTCQAAAFELGTCDCIGGGDSTQCTPEQAQQFSDSFIACQ